VAGERADRRIILTDVRSGDIQGGLTSQIELSGWKATGYNQMPRSGQVKLAADRAILLRHNKLNIWWLNITNISHCSH